jgi:hypothetical protein
MMTMNKTLSNHIHKIEGGGVVTESKKRKRTKEEEEVEEEAEEEEDDDDGGGGDDEKTEGKRISPIYPLRCLFVGNVEKVSN